MVISQGDPFYFPIIITFKITSSIKRAHHVFIRALNNAKLDDQTQNFYTYNTFSIANNRMINHAHREIENQVSTILRHHTMELSNQGYTQLLWSKKMAYDDVLIGSAITRDNLKKHFQLVLSTSI